MFNFLIITIISLLPLQHNYYVKNMSFIKIDNYQIKCKILKEVNQTKVAKRILKDKLAWFYKDTANKLFEKCKKSENPVRCAKSIIRFDFTSNVVNFAYLKPEQQERVYKSFFAILKYWKVDNNIVYKALDYLLTDEIIQVITRWWEFLTLKAKKKEENTTLITNKNFLQVLKSLYLSNGVINFKMNCNIVRIPKWGHEKLATTVYFAKDQSKDEIKTLIWNYEYLVCNNTSKICYNKIEVKDMLRNIRQSYLSWYQSDYTWSIKYILDNQSYLIWSWVKLQKVTLNTEKVKLIYQLLNKYIKWFSGDSIIYNWTWAEAKIKKIYETRYWKDLYELIKIVKDNNLYKLPKQQDEGPNKETKIENTKKHKVSSNALSKQKQETQKKKDIKKIEQSKKAIRKQLEKKVQDDNKWLYVIGGLIILILLIWGWFLYYKKRYEI